MNKSIVSILAVLILSISQSIGSTKFQETFSKSHNFKNGFLTISNTSGSINIESWDKKEILITVTKKGENEKVLKEIKGDINLSDSKASIKFNNPEKTSVDLLVKAPRDTKFIDINNNVGSIKIKDMDSDMKLNTTAGAIKITGSRNTIIATASTGSIYVSPESVTAAKEINLKTSVGKIEINLPTKWMLK